MNNAVTYFEIPVSNLERAITFYGAVFECDFERVEMDGNDMAYFRPSMVRQASLARWRTAKVTFPAGKARGCTSQARRLLRPCAGSNWRVAR